MLDKNIVVHENVIDDSLSDRLLHYAELNGNWQKFGLKQADGVIRINDQIRKDHEIWVERTAGLDNTRQILEPILRKYIDQHPLTKTHPPYLLYEMRMIRYEPDGFLSLHKDNTNLVRYSQDTHYGVQEHLVKEATYKWLTVCLYLSNHTGGHLGFIDGTVLKTKKNSLILFPGTEENYRHFSSNVVTGTKYTLTTWACS